MPLEILHRAAPCRNVPVTFALDSMEQLALTLSHDEAVVLFEFFCRFKDEDRLTLRHNAEFIALSALSAQIDKLLVEPFQSEYVALLDAARERLAQGFEGLAPGVEP